MIKNLSTVILAQNEGTKILSSLKSVSFCPEIVLVLDNSNETTLKTIKQFQKDYPGTLKIHQHSLNGDFATQRNFALSKASHEWILSIDADEEVSRNLQEEITKILKNPGNINGYFIRRQDVIYGKMLKFGETGHIFFLRLGRYDRGRWINKVHEVWQISGKTGYLKNPIIHSSHKDIKEFLVKINEYSTLVAQSWKEQGRRIGFWQILLYPAGKFLSNYLLKFGFLDGVPGLIMAVMMSFHSFLARGKLYTAYLNDEKNP